MRVVSRWPGFLRVENQNRGKPNRHGAENVLNRLQRPTSPDARRWIAVERILANVEIKGGEVRVHERGERRDDAREVEILVSLANLEIEFGELVQHQPLEPGHGRVADRITGFPMSEGSEHPANCVAQLSIVVANGFQDFGADALIVGV